jgi:GT2 family glycosyltransferase
MCGLHERKIIMWIDVSIPFEPGNLLATAYNRTLENSAADWVLFLDHDVFLTNPLWYEMCLQAIQDLWSDSKAACITCVSGGSRHHSNLARGENIPDSILHHINISKEYYKRYKNKLERVFEYPAGFFLLLNKEIAKKVMFRQMNKSINNIDVDFGTRLLDAGYNIYCMKGLYVHHRRGMKHLRKDFLNA